MFKGKQIELRYLDKSEIPNVVFAFMDDYYSKDIDWGQIAKKYENYARILVSYYNNNPIGYIAYYRNDFDSAIAFVSMLVVKEKYRNQGLASYMLKNVISDCAQNGFNCIRLEVNNENQKAIRLYEKYNFKFESRAGNNTSFYVLNIF